MKGDRVEVVVDTGNGVRTFEVVARRAGRRVETVTGRGVVEVTEVTRTGQAVRSARFLANRVVAVVEHPAADPVLPNERERSSSQERDQGRSRRSGDPRPGESASNDTP